jgi:membrane protease YdiL (CAAX protease family)
LTEDPGAPPAAPYLGLTTFKLEGRRAPALFVVGWVATFLGVALAALAAVGGSGGAGIAVWIVGLASLSLGLLLLGGSQAIERRAAGRAYAGPSPMLVFIVVLAASQLAGYAVGIPLEALGVKVDRPVADLLAVIVQAAVFLGVVRVMVVGADAMRWADMGIIRGASNIARGLAFGATYAFPIVIITAVLAAIAAQIAGAVPASPLPPTGTTGGLLLHLIAGALIAPAVEEVLFRGFALTAWRPALGDRGAIIRTSILFVLAHVLFVGGDSFGQAASLAFVGAVARIPVALALGWIFVRTGSLWAPIGLHATYNAVLIILGELAIPQ